MILGLLGIALLIGAGCYIGYVAANLAWQGNWKNRSQHKCGYVDNWGSPKVCPSCGLEDVDWQWRICCWTPLGWKFKPLTQEHP